MTIRHGLVLTFALAFGAAGCASGGGSSSSSTGGSIVPGAESLAQGERPRNDDNTRAAQRAIEDAEEAGTPAQAEQLYRQALASAEAAVAADPTNPLAHRLAGVAAIGAGDYVAADRHLDRAEELRPIYQFETEGIREQAWIDKYQEAVPLVNNQQYEEAAEVFEQANAIYDQRPEIYITLGQIYASLRRHQEALDNLAEAQRVLNSDKMVEMDSATVAQWEEQGAQIPALRASILADAGRLEEAAEAFRELADMEPDNVEYRRNLATILVQMGNNDEAFAVYEELLGMPGLRSEDYYTIGAGYYQADDYERAAEAFGMAAEANRYDRDALEMWARSLQLDSAYVDVPPVAERWIELDPASQNAWVILAQAQNQLGNANEARDAIGMVEELDVNIDELQLRRYASGGAAVEGTLINKKLDQGTPVTIEFTFYGDDGNVLGTERTVVTAGGAEMRERFRLEFASDQQVGGYSYEIQGM